MNLKHLIFLTVILFAAHTQCSSAATNASSVKIENYDPFYVFNGQGSRTVQGIQTDMYRLVTYGTCADSGFQNIYDSGKCVAAAKRLGKNISWGPHGGYSDVVNGCSVRDNTQLFLNPPGKCTSNLCECTASQPCCCEYTGLVGIGPKLTKAIASIKDHVVGLDVLTKEELEAAASDFSKNKFLLGTAPKFYLASFDLVDAYEEKFGPLFINDKTKYGFVRESNNDNLHLERIMVNVQQTILDLIYSGTTSDTTAGSQFPIDLPNYLSGRYWKTAKYFPGYVDPPADPTVKHEVKIMAKNAQIWPPNRFSCFDRDPLIRTTGVYLVPGGVATVKVPAELVNFDGTSLFEVRVGANDSNLKYHKYYMRMDRVTSSFPIVSENTTIASPLGGGIYIRVPYLADEGIIQVVISGDVVQAPIFSMSDLRTTERNEWENNLRNAPGPMADFETDKFLMQVPSPWIAKYSFDHLRNLAISRNAAMDGVNYLIGMLPSERNDYVFYVQPDFQIRSAGGYGVGYPQVNRNFRSGPDGIVDTHDRNGQKLYLEEPHYMWDVGYHELGHCSIPSYYRGEREALVNLIAVYVMNVVAGVDFDTSFMKSFNSQARFTPDRTAVDWMIRANFREGNEMSYSHDENDEFRYQQKGYARYADIAKLFGWEVLHKFWRQEHLDDAAGEKGAGDELDKVDSRTLRLSIAAGVDLTPLIHFWGIHPVDGPKLASQIHVDYNLKSSTSVQELLQHYVSLIPRDRDGFDVHHDAVYPGRPSSCASPLYGCGFYNVMKDLWDETYYESTRDAGLDIINKYFEPSTTLSLVPSHAPTGTQSTCFRSCNDITSTILQKCVVLCQSDEYCCGNRLNGEAPYSSNKKLSCANGCEIAFYSEDESDCTTSCTLGNTNTCRYTHPHISKSFSKCSICQKECNINGNYHPPEDACSSGCDKAANIKEFYEHTGSQCAPQKPRFLFAGQSNMLGHSNDAKAGLFEELVDILNSDRSKSETIADLETAIGNAEAADITSTKNEARILYDMRSLMDEKTITGAMEKVSCSYSDPSFTKSLDCEKNLSPYTCGGRDGHGGKDEYGPEFMFGHSFSKMNTVYTGQDVGITKVAVGGTTIYQNWSKSNAGSQNNYWNNLVDAIKASKGSMKGFVWFQGENDSFADDNIEGYLGNLTQFVSDVRNKIYETSSTFSSPNDVPVVIVELGQWIYGINQGVIEAQRTFVKSTVNTKLVNTGSSDIDSEKLTKYYHFDAAALLIIGDRIATALTDLLSLAPPSQSAGPSLIPSYVPTEKPVCEIPDDIFFYKMKKGKPVKKTCIWLAKKSKEKKGKKRVRKICKKNVDYFNKAGKIYGPAQTVCKDICKSCDPCYENRKSKYTLKKNEQFIKKTCKNISVLLNEEKKNTCKQEHFNSAKNVCPMSCEVNFPMCLMTSWKHVRHVSPGNAWHPATDQLVGNEVYSNGMAWSKDFESEVPGYNEFLFSTGDKVKWLVAPKKSILGWYVNSDRNITRSSLNPKEHSVKWYRREGALEDPWISLTDHHSAIGAGNILYGENNFGGSSASEVLPKHGGADVYIRKR